MRVYFLILVCLLLFILDAATTRYLAIHFPSGKELNPFITDTSSFTRILFSPINIIPVSAFLISLHLAEKMAPNYNHLIRLKSVRLMVFLFPLYFIFSKSIAVISNTFIMTGNNSPYLLLIRQMSILSDDIFQRMVFLDMFFAIFWGPLFFKLARAIYGKDSAP